MKFVVIFLSLLFVFEVSLAQEKAEESVKSEDGKTKYVCPKDPDIATVEKMIENYIEAEKLGYTDPRPNLITKECLNTPLPYPYKVVIPEAMIRDNSTPDRPFFITHHKIKNIRKSGLSSKSFINYRTEVETKGKDMSGNLVEFENRLWFVINQGEEAELAGCIWLYNGWKKPFIYERCYKQVQ